MRLSLSGFLFEENRHCQAVDFREFCRLARDCGYDGVELRRTQVTPDSSRQERRQMLGAVKDHGLTVTCLTARGMPAEGVERDRFFNRYLELCNDLECPLLKLGSADTAWCRSAAGRAQQHAVKLAQNNHIGGPLETIAGTRKFFRDVNHPNFGLLYDCMHLRTDGEDYLGCIDEFRPLTCNILMQCRRRNAAGEWQSAMPDAPGVQDWPAVFRAFHRHGYDGLVTVIENGWPAEKREAVARRCAEMIRKWTP